MSEDLCHMEGTDPDVCRTILDERDAMTDGDNVVHIDGGEVACRTPYHVNYGHCIRFAENVRRNVEGASVRNVQMLPESEVSPEERRLFGGHDWITKDGMHYDAECPQGTPEFRDLPIFVRHRWKERSGEWETDLDEIPISTRCRSP